jgi:PIN domain nuclease of toxin-antitoxin system
VGGWGLRVLLDTHALLWALGDVGKLSVRARECLLDPENEILVSAISAIEVAIKKSMGKLEFPGVFAAGVKAAGFTLCDVGFAVAEQLETLPYLHRDPFDRMLVAHAMSEGVPLVTRDPAIQRYSVQTIW